MSASLTRPFLAPSRGDLDTMMRAVAGARDGRARAVWWTISRAHYRNAQHDTRPGVIYALPFAFNALCGGLARDGPTPPSPFGHAQRYADLWRDAAVRGAPLPDRLVPWASPRPGRCFADLPNPFEALAAIEAAGYASLEYTGSATHGGAVFLVSPADG